MPRYKPFSSFLNPGMQNTNQNINNMNMPTNPYEYNIQPPTGGGLMGGVGGGAGGGGQLYGEGHGGFDPITGEGEQGQFDYPGSWGPYVPPDVIDPTILPQDKPSYPYKPISFGKDRPPFSQFEIPSAEIITKPPHLISPIGGVEEKFLGIQSDMPTDELPSGYSWQFINGEWIPVDMTYGGAGTGESEEGFYDPTNPLAILENIAEGIGEDIDLTNIPDWIQEILDNLGQGSSLDIPSYFQEPGAPMGKAPEVGGFGTGADIGTEEVDQPSGLGAPEEGFSWQFINGEWVQMPLSVIAPPPAVGGGGIKGSLAKQLYYPSTSGGFASTGSGISQGRLSQGSTLQELLRSMQG
jgi:hypothetical protein